MDKLKMHSPNFTEKNIDKIADLFPLCVTESTDAKGDLKRSIDFDQLRQELSSHIVDGPRERYHLNWPGKREALLTANAPIAKTLRPCREESVDFDTTENLFIEGDNLDALKLLQETYLGKVKMIYIDPPYNTGKDFIYKDDFKQSAEEYLYDSEQYDDEGNRLVANTDSNGRFHSDWLSMMYSRLKLARNLLKDDGVIFISIDDGEQHNIRKICEEIFGESNFVANIIWEKADSPRNTARQFSEDHDFVITISKKSEWVPSRLPRTKDANSIYSNSDNDPNGEWIAGDPFANKPYSKGLYTILGPTGRSFKPPAGRFWRISKERFEELNRIGRIWWGPNKDARPSIKRYLSEVSNLVPRTLWKKEHVGSNRTSKNELRNIFPSENPFDTPKPVGLIERMLRLVNSSSENQEIIMDFFCGSATTAHAVMQLNAEDGGKRKFIMVQLPEVCEEKSEAFKAGYKTIAEISKERIRRAGKKIKEENDVPDLDTGFRVLKVDSSNMAEVYYTPDAVSQEELFQNTDNIKPDRSSEDLLFQVLLDWGVDLTLPITKERISYRDVFFVDSNALAACFAKNGLITEEFCKELAGRKPLRVVFRDSGFKDDSAKINVEQIFKLLSPHTEVKTI